ncbi:hypothetical protein PMAYCL1PPCAC_18958, partial [Pristionchus mayeri]
ANFVSPVSLVLTREERQWRSGKRNEKQVLVMMVSDMMVMVMMSVMSMVMMMDECCCSHRMMMVMMMMREAVHVDHCHWGDRHWSILQFNDGILVVSRAYSWKGEHHYDEGQQ